jgi:hypothetical protein
MNLYHPNKKILKKVVVSQFLLINLAHESKAFVWMSYLIEITSNQ